MRFYDHLGTMHSCASHWIDFIQERKVHLAIFILIDDACNNAYSAYHIHTQVSK